MHIPRPSWKPAEIRVALWGAVIEALLIGLFLVRRVQHNAGDVSIPPGSAGAAALLAVLLAFGIAALAFAVRAIQKTPPSRALLLGFPILFALTMMVMPWPLGSTDIFDYIGDGRLLEAYGENPSRTIIHSYPDEPVVPHISKLSKELPSPYGPAWLLVSGLIGRVAGRELAPNLLLFRILGALSLLGVGIVAASIADRLRPGSFREVAVLLLWNPFLLFEFVQNAHNDGFMLLLLMASFALALKGRAVASGIFLAASTLVKYFPVLVALPLLSLLGGAGGSSFRFKKPLIALGSSIVAGLLITAPFFDHPPQPGYQFKLFHPFSASPLLVFLQGFFNVVMDGPPEHLNSEIQAAGAAALVIAAAICFISFWRTRNGLAFVSYASRTLIATYLFAIAWFMPWYLSWALPFLAIHGSRRMIYILSTIGVLSYLTSITWLLFVTTCWLILYRLALPWLKHRSETWLA